MLFTSSAFLLFFFCVYLLYWLSPASFRKPLLIVSSAIFYATWSLPFAAHFGTIIVLNFLINRKIQADSGRRWLYVSFALNGGNLFFFKYFYFGLEILGDILGVPGLTRQALDPWLQNALGISSVILPLAISFYTFQLTAYAIDLHRRAIDKPFSFSEYALFIMFFPQLIAGPIMRYSDFAGQIRNLPDISPSHESISGGLFLLFIGLFKKMVVANVMLPFNAAIFQNPGAYDWQSLIAACLGFSAYLYCDFSGYTDLARGLGKLMGLELPENFFAPYFSGSIRELWNNWHRTLTIWLRDYIYIPLGGHRGSTFRVSFNIILTMTLCGLWHGASYNFLLLGLYHGILIALESSWLRFRGVLFTSRDKIFPQEKKTPALPVRIARALLVYFLLNAGFILFQTKDLDAALLMYGRVLSLSSGETARGMESVGYSLLAVLGFHLLQIYGPRVQWGFKTRYALLTVAFFLLALILSSLSPGQKDFFYFQF